MKPAPFRYFAPESLDEALHLKAEHGDEARFLAGGQSLVPTMNFRLAQPAILIDLNAVEGLGGIEAAAARTSIRACTRYRTLERDAGLLAREPLMAEALPHIAHPQIRTRGTLGGNLAHADPASEMPAVMLARGARFHARSAGSGRDIAADDFFLGPLTTALHDDEMLVAVDLDIMPPRTGTAFMEVARRRGDFAMMGVAAIVTLDEGGLCTAARLAYCNAADRAVRADKAARSLVGTRLTAAEIAESAALVEAEIDPAGGLHASRAYQLHLAKTLTRRALALAAERARA